MDNKTLSNEAILRELGLRAQAQRLHLNQDQETFAYEAGLSVSTLYRLEKGSPVAFSAYIKVLRALGLLDRLENLIPDIEISPMQRASHSKGRERQRATGKRKTSIKASAKTSPKTSAKTGGWQGFKEPVSFEPDAAD